jgi:rifampicin phosphotransferase
MKLIYQLNQTGIPDLKAVGGKGLSLISMTKNKFPVPDGFILSSSFFSPWFELLKRTTSWKDFIESTDSNIAAICSSLKKETEKMVFSQTQKNALEKALKKLEINSANIKSKSQELLFAVRSSSPEEDLEGASFAGEYETMLGVNISCINEAIKSVFASCLDERVFKYKKEHGFNPFTPDIAVIIQNQVASESAGVIFTLNPLNNCYDEAVINANFGLGESVVGGQVTPDQYIIDKTNLKILEKKLGTKESTIILSKTGGVIAEKIIGSEQFCLSDNQIMEITNMAKKIETVFNKPMDLEWTFANNNLFLLQARPITSWIPLSEDMQTKPGEKRNLYLDSFLTQQGNQNAFSILGLEIYEIAQKSAFLHSLGSDKIIGKNGVAFNSGGRSYMHLSNYFKIIGKKQSIRLLETQDILSFKIVMKMNIKEFIPLKKPSALKGFILNMMKSGISSVKPMLKAYRKPAEYLELLLAEAEKCTSILNKSFSDNLQIDQFIEKTNSAMTDFNFQVSLPAILATEIARMNLKKLFKKMSTEVKEKIVFLEQALPNNVTIEMGLDMFKLSQFQEIAAFGLGKDFVQSLDSNSLSENFMTEWNSFMDKYGFRCPGELDLAVVRFSETPEKFFYQLKDLSSNTEINNNPQAIYLKGIKNREETEKMLKGLLSAGKKKKFDKYYNILLKFAAYREIPKYYSIMRLNLIRRLALKIGKKWKEEGRFFTKEQIFDLKVSDIVNGINNKTININEIAKKNIQFLKKIRNLHKFPRIIDSRGKIFRSTGTQINETTIKGEPISPGKVRGFVKVLITPDEKPLLPGEILVTRATDPGWTPLFLNAGGIVLEVGGLLQHGALVAREYCKPCIAGIEDVTTVLKDGQEIEIDGSDGTIHLL